MSIKSINFRVFTILIGVLTCLVTLIGLLGRFWWGFELATHFRVQYVVVLACCALLLLAGRRRGWAAGFTAIALLNATLVAPSFNKPAEPPVSDNKTVLRALLANVNSANRDYRRIRDTLIDWNPDFVVLLEATPWLMGRLTDLADRYPYRTAAPREDNFGIAFLSRRPFLQANIVGFGAAGLPSTVAEFEIDRHRLVIVGTHPLPPIGAKRAWSRNEQLLRLAEFARQTPDPLLLLGDLNLTPWSPHFERLLAGSGLRDSRDGRGLFPTWPAGWPPLWIPIDHALFSTGIGIRQRQTGPALGSDHYPVIVDFQVVGS